ncbi:amidohydrolase family protein [Flagellimonas crocea]|uniref:amidohydrolase family protein n=1 Tax=Flagellimonas crocea TaxID=3067311 RepID=UPI00296EF284|nr:amidohydrolase family protein [Muricauda sp. DH64]
MIKNIKTISFILILVTVLSCQTAKNTDNELLLKDITIVDIATGHLLANRNILIRKNTITSIDYNGNVNPGTKTYDCSDKYLIPGLMDMHVHLFNNVSQKPPNEWALPLFIKNGVTGIREMWTPLDSVKTIQKWRQELDSGEILPRILAVGSLVEGGNTPWVPNMPLVNNEEEAREFVRQTKKVGYDFVKVYSHIRPNIYLAIVDEANKVDMEVSGHIPVEVELAKALEVGQKTNEHLWQVQIAGTDREAAFLNERKVFYDNPYEVEDEYRLLDQQMLEAATIYNDSIFTQIARSISAGGQWQVPTLINEKRWYLGITKDRVIDSLLAQLPKQERENWMRALAENNDTFFGDSLSLEQGWKTYKKMVSVLSDNDVGLLAGTDYGQLFIYPGYSLHQELELFVEAGLSPLEALQTATTNPAKYLGLSNSLGTIKEGFLADLVILNENPLEHISNTQKIYSVILNGKFIPVSSQ